MKKFKNILGSKHALAITIGSVLLVVVLIFWLRNGDPEAIHLADHANSSIEPDASAESGENIAYVCPMMCVPPMENPGDCPVCGMALVAVSDSHIDSKATTSILRLSPEAVKLAQIQAAPVERKFVSADIRLFGQIDYDPAHMSYITAFMPAVIDRVYVKRAGQWVRWGDPLFDIYSSDLLETQKQLLEAVKYVPGFMAFQERAPYVARDSEVQVRKGVKDTEPTPPEVEEALKTIKAIRFKLSILGMPKRDIDELMKIGEATGIATVYASMYGQVIEHKAFEGMYVNTGSTIFAIGDPQFVWARLDAYEADYPWIRRGQEVTATTDVYPGETFTGKVVYIDPVFTAKTRTFDIGVIFPDKGGRMKAGMLVRAAIHAKLTADGKVVNENARTEHAPLVIPASAPLITGKRAVVYVALPDHEGVYEGREVVLGPKAKDHYVVLDGLKEGEKVVVNGNFKIDSAVQIHAKPSMMTIEGGHSATNYHHHGGSQEMDATYRSKRTQSHSRQTLQSERQESGMSDKIIRYGRPSYGRRTNRSSAITRRKPGVYGDTQKPKPLSQGE